MRMISIQNTLFLSILCLLVSVHHGSAENLPHGKLPLGVTPTAYEINLVVSPNEKRFAGEVHISARIDTSTNHIWMHGQGLDVAESYILDAGQTKIPVRYTEFEKSGIVKLEMDHFLDPGAVTIVFKYEAAFNTSPEGLYKARSGKQNYVYTHLEPLAARQMFPSFDEPRFKTPFTLSVNIPVGLVAISNGPEKKITKLAGNRKQVEFQTTQPIPTYLVALAVGKLDVVEWDPIPANSVRSFPIPLRGIAPAGKGAKMTYALKHTAALMTILEDYFGIPYPYAKLDLVAPASFQGAGMENAGAIFYRKNVILVGDNPSIYQLRYLASVHAHELAHSWFGNLVTPVWWDDLWLNESFASWMAARVIHTWRPDDFDDREPIRKGNYAKGNDQLVSARQIRQPVLNNHDIANAFDGITYSKGANVLSMMERFVGPDTFQQGIQQYISNHIHDVATADDFFEAMSNVAKNPDVIPAFRSFVEQPGTPKVAANWSCDGGGKTHITLKQSRSLPLGSQGSADKLWAIPMCLAYGDEDGRQSQCLLMTKETENIELPTINCPKWVVPNADGAAYVNFSLDQEGWSKLAKHKNSLNSGELLSALKSIDFDYAAGEASTEEMLDLAKLAALSDNWDIAKEPMQMLRNLKIFILPKTSLDASTKLMREIYKPALDRFDLSDKALAKAETTSNKALLRSNLIWFMALDAEEPGLRNTLRRLGKAYIGYGTDNKLHKQVLHPNLVRSALIVALQEEGVLFANNLIKRLGLGISATFSSNIIAALGYQDEPVLRKRVWAYILHPSTRNTVASQLLRRQARHVSNREALYTWITVNYDQIMDKIPRSHQPWMVWRLSNFCDTASRDRVEAFFADKVKDLRGAPRAMKNVLERIEICAAITHSRQADAVKTLKKYE